MNMDGTFRIFSSLMYGRVNDKACLVDAKICAPAIQCLPFCINFHQTGCRYFAVEQTKRVDQKTIASSMLSGTSDLLTTKSETRKRSDIFPDGQEIRIDRPFFPTKRLGMNDKSVPPR